MSLDNYWDDVDAENAGNPQVRDYELQEALDALTPHVHVQWECPNFYEDPKHYGYERIDGFYVSTDGYQWSALLVVRRSDGRVLFLRGGGCSCDSTREWTESQLQPLSSWQQFAELVARMVRTDSGRHIATGQRVLRNVAAALR